MAIEVGKKLFYVIGLLDLYEEKVKYDEKNDYHTLRLTDKEEDNIRLRFIEEPKHIPVSNIIWLESQGKLNIINFDKKFQMNLLTPSSLTTTNLFSLLNSEDTF